MKNNKTNKKQSLVAIIGVVNLTNCYARQTLQWIL